MVNAVMRLTVRHIQNMSEASSLQHHWGYADRAIPCTNDAGSCAYLDVVYHSHDLSMLYCGIMWATILGLLLVWALYHCSSSKSKEVLEPVSKGEQPHVSLGTVERIKVSLASYRRQYLLDEFARPIFGRTTRMQILVLATLTGYLIVFTFVGIVYNTWVTPVKKMPGVYNTRTSLGPWSDRLGVLAYALTPLSVLLSSRESLLSLITGLPYQSFNFVHRWLGYIIVAQSLLHTVGWCIVELRLYQPQPSVGLAWIKQLYMIWGVVAILFLFLLFILSTPWAIRKTGYEFFRKSHYVLAMLYIGACWGHWSRLSCYLIPALVVWFIDRAVRLVRTFLLHYNYIDVGSTMGFRSTDADITTFMDSVNGDVVRLNFTQPMEPWQIGQHFYLCFPKLNIWQSHPFTPLNVPRATSSGVPHSYIFRAKKGQTAKVARLTMAAPSSSTTNCGSDGKSQRRSTTTPVILNGPYGVSEVDDLTSSTNILCVAGGTGITYVLPVLLSQITHCACTSVRKLQLVWAIRQKADMEWIEVELDRLYDAARAMNLKISIFITREDSRMDNNGTNNINMVDKSANIGVVEKALTSSSTSSSEKDTTAPASGCCSSKVKPAATNEGREICSPPNPREPSIAIERRGNVRSAPPEIRHPDLAAIVRGFVEDTAEGPTTVYASGPGGMIGDLRTIVAGLNSGSKVWKGDQRGCVELKCDDRLEW